MQAMDIEWNKLKCILWDFNLLLFITCYVGIKLYKIIVKAAHIQCFLLLSNWSTLPSNNGQLVTGICLINWQQNVIHQTQLI